MKTLNTLRSYLAALLLLCPVVQAQDLSALGKLGGLLKKSTPVTKGKTAAVPAKDTKPKLPENKDTRPPEKKDTRPPEKKDTRTADNKDTRQRDNKDTRPPVVDKHVEPSKFTVEHRPDGTEISRRPDGKPRELHLANRNGAPMDVHHGLAGGRRVEVTRADHSRIVADGARRGYVEGPYRFGNREFAHRTYYVNGRAYDRFYGRYGYRGAVLEVYAPARYYPLGFYGWAYNTRWAAAPYAWGWAGDWYAYYGAYFTPYPVYANASLWLTDYLISQSLIGAYQAQVDAQIALSQLSPGQVALTPEVKQAIANEVQSQVALAYNEAKANSQNSDFDVQSGDIAGLLAESAPHVFLAGTALDLIDSTGQECAVTEGDVLQFTPPLPQSADAATLMVLAGKGGMECRPGRLVTVSFADLQEMQNHMRETVDQGLATLQAHQNGLPAPPPAAMAPATPASFENGAPPLDPAAAAQISQQYQDAEKAEQDALRPGAVTAAIPGVASQPPVVNLGMTVDQVVSIQGQPKMVADKGSQKIYIYERLKITFTDGKVSDMN